MIRAGQSQQSRQLCAFRSREFGPVAVLGAGFETLELSIVIPCLDEADTVGDCVSTAISACHANRIRAEVVVADNGSRDRSSEIATAAGARVVPVKQRGYGYALQSGIAAARGEAILIGDADGSYDFADVPRFVEQIRLGFDLVQGCRLPAGGGRILPGAMPWLHRRIGNPAFSGMTRRLFGAPVTDVFCGMRAFRRSLYDRLQLQQGGMEFAVEMIIRAALAQAEFAEIPITLHPDGRVTHGPHLRTFRDGLKTLQLILAIWWRVGDPKALPTIPNNATDNREVAAPEFAGR